MKRRFFLAAGLALAGLGRRVRAQAVDMPVRYVPLTRPIRIALSEVTAAWQPVPFVAEGMAPATAAAQPRRVLINGVLFRTPTHLSALCVTCPHEQCQVDLVTDATRLSRMSGGTVSHPLFECGCHLSVFDAAADGARISGEAPRGLYRFRVAATGDAVEIADIEDVALTEV
jgi:Rieske Fe-S protein